MLLEIQFCLRVEEKIVFACLSFMKETHTNLPCDVI